MQVKQDAIDRRCKKNDRVTFKEETVMLNKKLAWLSWNLARGYPCAKDARGDAWKWQVQSSFTTALYKIQPEVWSKVTFNIFLSLYAPQMVTKSEAFRTHQLFAI